MQFIKSLKFKIGIAVLVIMAIQAAAQLILPLVINNEFVIDMVSNLGLPFLNIVLLLTYINFKTLKPLEHINEKINKYADGDFTEQINVTSTEDEIGVLATSLNRMNENTKALLKEITEDSQLLASHSQQLAASNEEISATMEEITTTTQEVSTTSQQGYNSVKEAIEEANETMETAKEGAKAVGLVTKHNNEINVYDKEIATNMEELTSLSSQIGKITEVITGISEQTNLLALNAAIEAARAGEYGKGFAVVAEEVRNLAEQSSNSTNEIAQIVYDVQDYIIKINEMLNKTGEKRQAGMDLSISANKSLNYIQKAVQNTIKEIEEVANGAKQSTEGMEQVASSNEQISASIQQMNSAAQELADIANTLQTSVEKFKA